MNNNKKTGFATIDQPWLSQYDKLENTKLGNNQTVWDVTEEMLIKFAEIPFIEYFGNNISRETFHDYVVTWAKTFRSLGVEPGDQIPLYVPATPESFAMFFAANAIGAIPYYQKLAITNEALENETSEAKIAVVFDSLWPNVKDVFSDSRFKNIIVTSAADSMMFPLRQITKAKSYFENKKNNLAGDKRFLWTDDAKKIANYFTGEYKVPFEKNRIAAITTSSGTTSHVVKGIMDTNEGILESLGCTIDAETGFTKGKRTLTCFPPTASTSINCLQLLPTYTGGTIVFDPRVDTKIWYDQLMKYKPDITISTGAVWETFINKLLEQEQKGKKHDLSWVDYFIMGGSGTTPEILEWMNSTLLNRGAQRPIKVGYGFSEVFGVLSVEKYGKDTNFNNSERPVINVGIPLPRYNIGIFDENGNELQYGQGNRGELWIKAPSNMEGYYKKPEKTAQTFVDGWIKSGDLCEIDEFGNIYYYGRIKNNINVDNEKTYLFDISNELRKQFRLHDILLEKRNLDNNENALTISFVQNEDYRIDEKEILTKIDSYLSKKNIIIDGYKEFYDSLPIDPTTLKARTKDLDGYIKYINNEKYNISFDEIALDTYSKLVEKEKVKELVK